MAQKLPTRTQYDVTAPDLNPKKPIARTQSLDLRANLDFAFWKPLIPLGLGLVQPPPRLSQQEGPHKSQEALLASQMLHRRY